MWISQKNENQRWSKDHQPKTSDRQKKTDHCLKATYTFPKSARLLKRSQFKKIFSQGKRLVGHLIAFNYRLGTSGRPRLGITVSKKYGKAHDRNRFKRVVKESFRELQRHLPPAFELNVMPHRISSEITKASILSEMQYLIQQIQNPPYTKNNIWPESKPRE